MDFLPGVDTFSLWMMNYGSFVLFILLTVGIIALPVPEETLMVIAGILMHKGKLHIPSTIIAAFLGSLCGITISYWIGKTAGQFLITKYGSWVGITQARFEKAHIWFEKFGRWALLIGYFIPGVRHLTGLSAGVSGFSYRQFAFYAYTGALIWVSIFLSIGYFFGKQWLALYDKIKPESNYVFFFLGLIPLAILIYFLKKLWKR
jgi:membrane protein DedA with SNARE-associated domain